MIRIGVSSLSRSWIYTSKALSRSRTSGATSRKCFSTGVVLSIVTLCSTRSIYNLFSMKSTQTRTDRSTTGIIVSVSIEIQIWSTGMHFWIPIPGSKMMIKINRWLNRSKSKSGRSFTSKIMRSQVWNEKPLSKNMNCNKCEVKSKKKWDKWNKKWIRWKDKQKPTSTLYMI